MKTSRGFLTRSVASLSRRRPRRPIARTPSPRRSTRRRPAPEPFDESESEIDTCGDPAGSEHVVVIHYARVDDFDRRVLQLRYRAVVRGRTSSAEESCVLQYHRPGTDGRDECATLVRSLDRCWELTSLYFCPRASLDTVVPPAAGHEEHVWVLGDGPVRLGVGEDLVGTQRVEFVEAVEHDDLDRRGARGARSHGPLGLSPPVPAVSTASPLECTVGDTRRSSKRVRHTRSKDCLEPGDRTPSDVCGHWITMQLNHRSEVCSIWCKRWVW